MNSDSPNTADIVERFRYALNKLRDSQRWPFRDDRASVDLNSLCDVLNLGPEAAAIITELREALEEGRIAAAADVEECEQSDSHTFLPVFKARLAKIEAALKDHRKAQAHDSH